MGRVTGTVERHEKGYGFLIPDRSDLEDIFLPPGQLKGSITGDRVEIKTRSSRRGDDPVGQVIRILERGVERLTGVVHIDDDKTEVVSNSVEMPTPVRVPHQANSERVEEGEVVEVEIETYSPLQGVIVEVLGRPGDPKVEEKVILKKYDLDLDFPDEVERAARSLPDRVPDQARRGRRDLTDLLTVTIDPVDAKDLDDAISVTPAGDETFNVCVHITDVSHYVEMGSALDEEALERATSTYLADKVVPMFPKAFSNGIGSLNDGEDRLAVTVVLTVDRTGEVREAEFHESCIRVDHRLSYEQVDDYLEKDQTPPELEGLESILDRIVDISQKMRVRRLERGGLDFDLPEVSLRFEGEELEEIVQVEHTLSHQAIEEFMIAANEAVAEYLTDQNAPVLYRVHEPPAGEDVETFAKFIEGLGYQLAADDDVHPKQFQRILDRARDRPEERIIAWNMLRSMQKARYAPDNLQHFGLASTCYCHFTSPIRRYPDLVIHRVLKAYLERNDAAGRRLSRINADLPELATHTSERERAATDAERESIKVRLLEHMEDRVGEETEGYVSSVVEFGCFVQMENTLEGLIHVANLDDYYVYNAEQYTLTGESSGTVLRIGDRVRVRVARVDVPGRELDFELLEILETQMGSLS